MNTRQLPDKTRFIVEQMEVDETAYVPPDRFRFMRGLFVFFVSEDSLVCGVALDPADVPITRRNLEEWTVPKEYDRSILDTLESLHGPSLGEPLKDKRGHLIVYLV